MENQLEEVKKRIGITGNYQDVLLSGYIDDVKAYLIDAGVPKATLETDQAVGVIARGVNDLWDYGNGEASFSPYFYQRAIQLAAGNKDAGI